MPKPRQKSQASPRPALVVALNPSVDVEWQLDRVRPVEKNVVRSIRRWPGGKGVNVARWLNHVGLPSRLLLPLGGEPGREMSSGLADWKVSTRRVPIRQASRVNVIVTPDEGPQIRFNEPGPVLSGSDWIEVKRAVAGLLPKSSVMVLSGSLPRGVPASAYRQLVRLARAHGVPALLDCEGASLALALEAKPFLVKPNEHELAEWAGSKLEGEDSVLGAAASLAGITGGWVFVSRGAEGALLVNAARSVAWRVVPPRVEVRNTVGAGDALLAVVTWRLVRGDAPEAWLPWGVATGTVMTTFPAGRLPAMREIARLARRLRPEPMSLGVPLDILRSRRNTVQVCPLPPSGTLTHPMGEGRGETSPKGLSRVEPPNLISDPSLRVSGERVPEGRERSSKATVRGEGEFVSHPVDS